MRRVEGVKAFFVNDPSLAWNEIRELSQIDRDMSGTTDQTTRRGLKSKLVFLTFNPTEDKLYLEN